jgi:hypothetical protein
LINSRRYLQLKQFSLAILLFIGCNTNQTKQLSSQPIAQDHEHNTKASDTTTLFWHVSTGRERELNALSNRNRKEYARTVLKQYAFCNCLFQAFRGDSAFFSTDNSNGFLAIDIVAHSNDVIDSVSSTIKTYVSQMDSSFEPKGKRPVSLFCLDLYESRFLDSLVKHYDSKITKPLDTQ